MMNDAILVTGATGLLGGDTLRRLLAAHPRLTAYALARDLARLPADLRCRRVIPLRGDLLRPGLGLDSVVRARLRREVRAVLHFAADTRFSQTREGAVAVNVRGTERVLELAAEVGAQRVVFASTAFVVGRRTGRVQPGAGAADGWVNHYERSKHEAEDAVRASGLAWLILRPSTVVFDAEADAVTQVNAVHRALRVFRAGLAAMVPGEESSPVDVVTADYVAEASARLAFHPEAEGRTLHLCAGDGAMPVGELLDEAHAHWSRDEGWRRRRVERPALTGLETWRLMERSVEETGSPRLVSVIRSLSHFAPQLAYPKRFDTSATDALLGFPAPPVRTFWTRMLERLEDAGKVVAA
ncbi:MAG TPA: SDR family oxidoreductase [Longimicrobiales bacterium]|nr:SDR family oxidoreductase [Longimicrobiales bacterium]